MIVHCELPTLFLRCVGTSAKLSEVSEIADQGLMVQLVHRCMYWVPALCQTLLWGYNNTQKKYKSQVTQQESCTACIGLQIGLMFKSVLNL